MAFEKAFEHFKRAWRLRRGPPIGQMSSDVGMREVDQSPRGYRMVRVNVAQVGVGTAWKKACTNPARFKE